MGLAKTMTSLSVWILLILGFVTIERIYGVDMSPDLQAGSMEGAVQRPVLFSSTAEVKQYLDTLGKKMRQRYLSFLSISQFIRTLKN